LYCIVEYLVGDAFILHWLAKAICRQVFDYVQICYGMK